MFFGGDKFGQRFVGLWSRKAHGKPFTWRRADSDHGQQEKCCLEKIGSGFSEVIQSNLINVLIHPHFCAAAWGKESQPPKPNIPFQCLMLEKNRWLTSEILQNVSRCQVSPEILQDERLKSPDLLFTLAVSRLFVPLRCLADVFTFSPWRCRVCVVSTHFKNIHLNLNEHQQKIPRSKDI